MTLDLADYETKAREAVKAFWGNRAAAVAKQKELGRGDQGERAGVTAGKNMDGFIALIQDVIRANGLTDAHMMMERRVLTLPGFFRPTCCQLVLSLRRPSGVRVSPEFSATSVVCPARRDIQSAVVRSFGVKPATTPALARKDSQRSL